MKFRTRTVLSALVMTLSIAATPMGAQAESWQCVPFARLISGIQIFGDAHTWWSQAQGKYQTGERPQKGSVLVFRPHGNMRLGHVAVISNVLTDRIVQVDHANWSQINGRRGQVEEDVTVVDVSPNNDWSEVKVWYNPIGDLGTTVYPTYGFIYQDSQATTLAQNAPGDESPLIPVAEPLAVAAASPAADPLAALIQRSSLLAQ